MSTTVKNQLEYSLYYTFREVGYIGTLEVDQNGTDLTDYQSKVDKMSEENQDALTNGTYGNTLYLIIQDKAQGPKPVTLTITGTDQNDASATKDIIVPARVQIAQCILVDDPAQKWKTITSVLVKSSQPSGSAPTLGTRFSLVMFPQKADFTADTKGGLLAFSKDFDWDPGETLRPIGDKYEAVDHYKRKPGENSISLGQRYTVFGKSLEYLRNRECTLLAEGHEDGSAQIFEKRYFSRVMLNIKGNAPDGGDLEIKGNGKFREMLLVE